MEKKEKTPDHLKKEVGERCRILRRRAGFSSADSAAIALDVSSTAVYEVERGENLLSAEMLLKMSAVYDAPEAAFYPGFENGLEPTPEEAVDIIAKAIATKKQPEIVEKAPTPKGVVETHSLPLSIPGIDDAELQGLIEDLRENPDGIYVARTAARGSVAAARKNSDNRSKS